MRIAIQGELGSFSHEAALKLEPQATIVPCALSAEVFKRVENAEVSAAVIPIENSLAGSVLEHFDLLLKHDVKVVEETLVRIHHNLIAMPGVSFSRVILLRAKTKQNEDSKSFVSPTHRGQRNFSYSMPNR